MTAQLVELQTRPKKINKDVIGVLEQWLEDARKGEITGIAIAGVVADGAMQHSWSCTDHVGTLVGAISRLSYRLNQSLDDNTTST